MDEHTLTPRQRQILNWILRHAAEQGTPPTRAEIAAAFGFSSPNAAEDHLRRLARKGMLELLPGLSRGIRLLPQGHTATGRRHAARRATSVATATATATLPLVGRVAAGSPILAQQNIEMELPIDAALFRPRADYLLRVHGDSMRDAGILDGDLLAVQRSPEARERQIVVARIGEEVTVKRLHWQGARLQLLPCNPAYAPIEIDPDREDFAIEGLAVGVLRRLE